MDGLVVLLLPLADPSLLIGNKLRHPKGKFPPWVSKSDQDPLFWVSGADGVSLLKKIGGALCFFVFAVASTAGSGEVLAALSGIQSRAQDGPRLKRTSSQG